MTKHVRVGGTAIARVPLMETCEQIRRRAKRTRGWLVQTCRIAHCKELEGLPFRRARNGAGARG